MAMPPEIMFVNGFSKTEIPYDLLYDTARTATER